MIAGGLGLVGVGLWIGAATTLGIGLAVGIIPGVIGIVAGLMGADE